MDNVLAERPAIVGFRFWDSIKVMTVKKVLVVDNDASFITFMDMFLKKQGYQVRTAEDGLSALRVLKEFTPEVMLIDLIMPNIGGDKLCLIIRNTERLKDAFLVLVSAISAEEEGLYLRYGFDACIAKGPLKVTGEHVLTLIRQFEAGKKSDSEPATLGLDGIAKREITKELLSTKDWWAGWLLP